MQVVILCGGMGTRLREETEFRPKPMVAIGHRPILWHIMKLYAHHGHKDFVLCLGYKGEVIKQYFFNYALLTHDVTVQLGPQRSVELHQNGTHTEDWSVCLVDTGAQTLKGARLKKIERYIREPTFMVTYGDGVANVDLEALLAFHHRHGRLATVTGVHPRSAFGELRADQGCVTAFTEKPQLAAGVINGGFFVFQREIFDLLNDQENCDLEVGLLETLARQGQLMMYLHEGGWACMDTYRDVEHLNQLWRGGQAFWKVWP